MYILILLLTIPHTLQGTITFLESYQRPKKSGTINIAGEIHDTDPAGQRNVLIHSIKMYAQKSNRPLSVYIEDPLAIPGLEQIQPNRGILLGLTAQLQQMNFPSHITIANFDTKKAANCAIHFLSQENPRLHEKEKFNSVTVGHLITELCRSYDQFQNHKIVSHLEYQAQKEYRKQLAVIQSSLDAFTAQCISLKISPGDSIAQTAVKYATQQPRSYRQLYTHVYQADVELTSFAALIATYESKNNMALVCGERHAQDVSLILNYDQWPKLYSPGSFTDHWLIPVSS